MSVATLIRKKRKEKGLSQRALAAMLGISHGAVAQWELESGTKPDHVRRAALAVILGVEPRSLQTGDGPYEGEFVEDPDELALLGFFRTLDGPDRQSFVRSLFAARRTGRNAA